MSLQEPSTSSRASAPSVATSESLLSTVARTSALRSQPYRCLCLPSLIYSSKLSNGFFLGAFLFFYHSLLTNIDVKTIPIATSLIIWPALKPCSCWSGSRTSTRTSTSSQHAALSRSLILTNLALTPRVSYFFVVNGAYQQRLGLLVPLSSGSYKAGCEGGKLIYSLGAKHRLNRLPN